MALAISGCAPGVPAPPEMLQCQYNGTPRAFYCVNTKTKERVKLEAGDAKMKAAQCLSADDYKKGQAWVKVLIDMLSAKEGQ